MGSRIPKWGYSSDIPRIEYNAMNDSIEPIQVYESMEYLEWLRQGLVCHLDKVTFDIIPPINKKDAKSYRGFNNEVLNELKSIYKNTYDDINTSGGNLKSYYAKKKKNKSARKDVYPFRRWTTIENHYIVIHIDSERDYSIASKWKSDARIYITWKRKYDYSGYTPFIEQLELVLYKLKLNCQVCHAEIAVDTLSSCIWNYTFNHTLVKGGSSEEIMWNDPTYKRNNGNRGGMVHNATDTYQNNRWNIRQLCNHVKNRPEDYYDHIMHSHIKRSEIRVKKSIIVSYGLPVVKTLVDNMEQIYRDNVLWKQVQANKMDELTLSDDDRRRIAVAPIIYWIWVLIGLGISIGTARDSYCRDVDSLSFRNVF